MISWSGARFSKVPRTFRARKAIRKITTCLFCKAELFTRCKGNKNKNNGKVSCLEDAFVLKIQRELCHPKYARKVSGLSRNRPRARLEGLRYRPETMIPAVKKGIRLDEDVLTIFFPSWLGLREIFVASLKKPFSK